MPMKKFTLLICSFLVSSSVFAQRYTTEIFNDSEIAVMSDVSYGVNFNPYVDSAMLGGTNLQPIQTDFYMPSPTADTTTNRPVVIVWHTGSFIPKRMNGSPLGTRQDKTIVE